MKGGDDEYMDDKEFEKRYGGKIDKSRDGKTNPLATV